MFSLIKKNKKIHYLCKTFKHINDEKYVEFYLNMESDPLLWKFDNFGTENFKKMIYVIPENGSGWGFFAEFRAVLAKLLFADRYGMIPYIYWGNGFLYSEKSKVRGTENAFEYFFLQPAGLAENDVKMSRMVQKAKDVQAVMIEREYKKKEQYDISDEYLLDMGKIYAKYIRFNEWTEIRLGEETAALLNGKKTLAVHYRGTDYKVGYDIHPKIVQIQQEIEAVKKIKDQMGFDQIFLATDEENAIQKFKEVFGEELVFYKDVYRGNSNVSVAFSEDTRELHKYKLGYEVLRDMYTLSLCDGLIAGLSQVITCARVAKQSRNEKYEYLEIINNGINHNNTIYSYKGGKR